jgi:hypothetical protein
LALADKIDSLSNIFKLTGETAAIQKFSAMFGLILFAGSLLTWLNWYIRLIEIYSPTSSWRTRAPLATAPVVCLLLFFWAFYRFGDQSTVSELEYFLGFAAVCVMSLRLILEVLDFLGVQPQRDAIERSNPASLPTIAGALLAMTALNIGSNIGYGDDIHTTLFPLAVSTGLLLAVVGAVVVFTPVAESIAIGRNLSAGIRFGALWISASIPLARAAAGDWESFITTTIDLVGVLPNLLFLFLVAVWSERHSLGKGAWMGTVVPLTTFAAIAAVSFFIPPASTW